MTEEQIYTPTDNQYSRFKALAKKVLNYAETSRIIILAVLIGVLGIVSGGTTFTVSNAWNILSTASINAIATIGQFFAMLVGGIDLSIQALAVLAMGVGGELSSGAESTAAIVMREAVPLPLVIPIMFGITIGWGLFSGMLWTRAKIPALIVGLAMWQVALGANLFTIGGRTILGIPRTLAIIGQGVLPGGFPVPFLICILVSIGVYVILYHTRFGRNAHAVGTDEVNAYLSGINVQRIRMLGYAFLGFFMGLASVMFMARSMTVSTRSVPDLHFDTITAVFIGGMTIGGGGGTLIGTIIGVIILAVISNGMTLLGVDTQWVQIIKGSILIAAVAIAYMRKPAEEKWSIET